MRPKEICDAQPEPTDPTERKMEHAAIRKLMRDMMKKGLLHQSADGRYSLLNSLSQTEINAAPRKAFEQGLRTLMANHKLRHTVSAVFISVLEKVLNELKSKST